MADRLVVFISLVVGLGFLVWLGLAVTPRASLEEASGPEFLARVEAAEALFERDPSILQSMRDRTRRTMDRTIEKLRLDAPDPTPEQEADLADLAEQAARDAFDASREEAITYYATHYDVDELNVISENRWMLHVHLRILLKSQSLGDEIKAYRETLQQIRDETAGQVFCEGSTLLRGPETSDSDCSP
ncbi:MAG: hypothetical protein AAGE80_17725 [Pseudomonadota bacterium]